MTTCPGPSRTPSAMVCSWPPSSKPKEISSNARPKPSARAVNRVPRGLRHRLRQPILTKSRALVTLRPYESLPSVESAQRATQDKAQTLELSRPGRALPDCRRENPAARTRDDLPLLLRETRPHRWRRLSPGHAPANPRGSERQPTLL